MNDDKAMTKHQVQANEDDAFRQHALREMRESIERQERQRAHWPDDLRLAMTKLANLFPTMHGVPGTDPWNVDQLTAWLNTGAPSSGSRWAAMFLLCVWNPRTNWHKECGVKHPKSGKFDLGLAMHAWDQQHIDAMKEWIENPFFP